jgi:hypothetical protein
MEEEKRVPNYNPEEDDKEYIGTKLLDGIERGASSWYKDERTLEGWEYLNPFSVATAGAIRGVEGVGWVLGNTPVAGDLLRGIGWAEDRLAEGARNISGALTPDLDPRFAGWGTRLGTAILADKGIRKVAGATKATIKEGAERAAVRSGKKYTSTRPETMSDVWKDDLAGPSKTFERTNKRGYYPENPPDDPWIDPKDIEKARSNIKMSLFNYIDSQKDVPIPPNPTFEDMVSLKQTIMEAPAALKKEAQNPNISLTKRIELSRSGVGFTATGWYNYKGFRKASSKMPDDGRLYAADFTSPQKLSGQDRAINLPVLKKENLPKLREEFGPVLETLGIKGGAQIHHIAALKATIGIYNDTQYMSPLYREITDTLLEELPGLGNMEGNLLGVIGGAKEVKTPHGIVHKFYRNKIGESGELFFTDRVLESMNRSKEYRLLKARELAKIIRRSEAIVRQAMENLRLSHSRTLKISPKNLVKRLSKFDNDGYLKVDKNYQVSNMNELIKTIQFQDAIDPLVPAVKKVKNPKALQALELAVQKGMSSVKALKETKYGKQLELTLDQITPKNLPRIQRIYDYNKNIFIE